MSTSNNTNIPGFMPITVKSLPPGAGNERDAAISQQQQMNAYQNNQNKTVSGGKRRRRYRGGNGSFAVPQFKMNYTPTGGPGTDPNDQIAGNLTTSTQSSANNVYDNQATQMGGYNPNWSWGCYSGGKRKRRTRRRHNRKSHKHHTRKASRRHRHR